MANLNSENLVEGGLKEMRKLYKEYQDKHKGSEAVREFLAKAFQDEALLKRYLIGRKYRAKYAWETLRSYGEVRYDKYPEMFPATLPPKELLLCENNEPSFGVLKGRDSQGRRIAYFQLSGWDTDKCSLEELNILTLPVFEKFLLDEDGLNNGLIFVQDNSGMGFNHAKHYSLFAMLRILNIYWYSFPLKVKGVYFVNVPSFLTFLYAMIKPFLPTKLKERFLLTTTNQGFTELHERLSPEILPKCLGGNLKARHANDPEFIDL